MEFERDSSQFKVENQNLNMYVPQLIGVKEVIQELNNLDKDLLRQMRREIITEIRPLYGVIKSRIPSTRPLSGFDHNGRTSWNQPVRVTGKVSYRSRQGKNSLVSIRTSSSAVEIADMAGKRNKFDVGREGSYRGFSAEYIKNGRKVRHRLNGQGKKMIEKLGGTPSRYVWPAVEQFRPMITQKIKGIVDSYAEIVNRKLIQTKGGNF
jgi:hypothetical protein